MYLESNKIIEFKILNLFLIFKDKDILKKEQLQI